MCFHSPNRSCSSFRNSLLDYQQYKVSIQKKYPWFSYKLWKKNLKMEIASLLEWESRCVSAFFILFLWVYEYSKKISWGLSSSVVFQNSTFSIGDSWESTFSLFLSLFPPLSPSCFHFSSLSLYHLKTSSGSHVCCPMATLFSPTISCAYTHKINNFLLFCF